MPKGKKFNAAEKHFEQKRIKMQKEIDRYKKNCIDLRIENGGLSYEIETLKEQTRQQQDWIDRLLEYTELEPSDIKKACEKDKKMLSLLDMFDVLGVTGKRGLPYWRQSNSKI